MYCPKCGCSFPDGVEKCTYCGGKLVEQGEGTGETRPATPEIQEDPDRNTKIMLGVLERGKGKIQDSWDLMTTFNRVITVGLLAALLLCLLAFLFGRVLAGILGIDMLCLLIAAWLLNRRILRSPNPHLRKLLVAAAAVLLIPYFFAVRIPRTPTPVAPEPAETVTEPAPLSWPAHPMARLLPQPDTGKSDVLADTGSLFSAAVEGLTREQFDAYVGLCKGAGFEKEEISHPDFRDLRNRENYALTLYFSEDGRMVVTLRAPIRKAELTLSCEANRLMNRYDVEVYVARVPRFTPST